MRMGSNRRLSWMVPFVFAALALGCFALIATLQPKPQSAGVVDERGSPFSSDYILTVTYQTEDGIDIVEQVVSFQPYDAGDVVLIWPETEDSAAMVASEPLELTVGSALVVIGFGLLLGLVVTLSVNGFGFVPGTGRTGETDPEEIHESRGFYWRS